ncbi:Peptidase M15 [Clostridium cavendishii DSM 21758]|uniref:Peptidase M15 n=1 Tax=Clostridium cavendishii DSM 21758 TaxID=1121302 RepID=A0A1M6P668_9CLOT|nr:Peptidase M15 [Clostridium cavendishii DSM 21758]
MGFDLGSYGADGSFGQCTLDAEKGIQSASGITTDGIVGSATNSKVSEWLSKPSCGASTPHFSQSEFKCPCCGSLGGGMKTSLLLRLEALKAKLGGKSIRINSGYRCAKHNAEGILGNGGLGRYNSLYHLKFLFLQ